MAIDCRLEQERMYFRLTGEIGHHRAGELMRQLETQLDLESPRQVELDMSGVTFMDSSGIALLLRLYRSWPSPGESSRWSRCPSSRARCSKAAGLERMFSISYL